MAKNKSNAGRPLLYDSVEHLSADCDLYFYSCDYDEAGEKREKPTPYTITGLALALNTSRQTLINYEDRPEYFDTIKKAKLRVENYAELRLFQSNPTGPIFALKNFEWSDKLEHKVSGNLSLTEALDEIDGKNKGPTCTD